MPLFACPQALGRQVGIHSPKVDQPSCSGSRVPIGAVLPCTFYRVLAALPWLGFPLSSPLPRHTFPRSPFPPSSSFLLSLPVVLCVAAEQGEGGLEVRQGDEDVLAFLGKVGGAVTDRIQKEQVSFHPGFALSPKSCGQNPSLGTDPRGESR